jgi:hypothetical protein
MRSSESAKRQSMLYRFNQHVEFAGPAVTPISSAIGTPIHQRIKHPTFRSSPRWFRGQPWR